MAAVETILAVHVISSNKSRNASGLFTNNRTRMQIGSSTELRTRLVRETREMTRYAREGQPANMVEGRARI